MTVRLCSIMCFRIQFFFSFSCCCCFGCKFLFFTSKKWWIKQIMNFFICWYFCCRPVVWCYSNTECEFIVVEFLIFLHNFRSVYCCECALKQKYTFFFWLEIIFFSFFFIENCYLVPLIIIKWLTRMNDSVSCYGC